MKKIRLNVDELEVRSFVTDDAPERRGTVHGREYTEGHDQSCFGGCIQQTHEFETCYQTGFTCGATCDWGCGEYSNPCVSDTGHCGPRIRSPADSAGPI